MRYHLYEKTLPKNGRAGKNTFSYEWFRTETRFDTEAQGYLEMPGSVA